MKTSTVILLVVGGVFVYGIYTVGNAANNGINGAENAFQNGLNTLNQYSPATIFQQGIDGILNIFGGGSGISQTQVPTGGIENGLPPGALSTGGTYSGYLGQYGTELNGLNNFVGTGGVYA